MCYHASNVVTYGSDYIYSGQGKCGRTSHMYVADLQLHKSVVLITTNYDLCGNDLDLLLGE